MRVVGKKILPSRIYSKVRGFIEKRACGFPCRRRWRLFEKLMQLDIFSHIHLHIGQNGNRCGYKIVSSLC